MKRPIVALALLISTSSYSQSLKFNNLTKEDVENVTKEFGANFTHTAVAAPETNGGWGLEVGVVAGQTSTPELEEVVTKSGGDGSDFKQINHGGFMGRVHVPLDLFAEMSILPRQEFDDFSVESRSYAVGWNLGGLIGLPFDLAVGAQRANGKLTFSQTGPTADINLDTTTTNYWVGASKTFFFITPYIKVGKSTIEGELKTTASIFGYTASTTETVGPISGNFLATGANFELGFLKLGVEASQIVDVKRLSAKISLDF